MGVSGSGKSTIAEAVAQKMNVPFIDGDFLHPRHNIDKMTSGQPLDDEDRKPWLEAINSAIYAMQHTHAVSLIACSALKKKYRDTLRENTRGIYFIYLKGDYSLIAQRMQQRKNHFFSTQMLQSQFDALEEPLNNHHDIYTIAINDTPDKIIANVTLFINKTTHTD